MNLLRQSTTATVLVGPVLDASGVAVTTATIADFTLTKNGGSPAALGSPTTATHSHNGHYLIALTAGNADTTGRLTISANNSSHAMPLFRFTVLPQSVFDAIVVNAVNTTGGLPVATGSISALAGAISTYAGADTAGTTTLLSRVTDAVALAGTAPSWYTVPLTTLGANAPDGWIRSATFAAGATIPAVTSVTNRVTANADQLAGQTVSAAGAVTFPGTVSSLDAAGVRSAVGLASANLDTQLDGIPTVSELNARTLASGDYATSAALTTVAGYLDTEIAAILEDTGTTLPAQIAALTIPSASANASAVRTELATELGRLDVAVSTRSALDAAGVRSALGLAAANLDTQLGDVPTVSEFNARTLASADYATATTAAAILEDTGTTLPAQVSALSIPTTAEIADRVLGRNLAGGSDGGRTVRDSLRVSRNRVAINEDTGTITVYAEDDTTVAFTGVVTAAVATTGWKEINPA